MPTSVEDVDPWIGNHAVPRSPNVVLTAEPIPGPPLAHLDGAGLEALELAGEVEVRPRRAHKPCDAAGQV